MTVEEILQYYSDLLIIQYNDKTRAKATIEALVKTLIANNVMIDVVNGFDLDTALGVQLDVLGKYIGADRFYSGTIYDEVYFGYSDAFFFEPPLVTGFSDASDFFTKDGKFLSASSVLSPGNSLNDDDYRILLKLKVFQNNIDHSVASIDDALFSIFGTSIYMTDNYNMTMTYFIPEEETALIKAAIEKDILLRPMGVGINVLQDEIFFGFSNSNQSYPSDIDGFSSASDFLTKDGEFLGIDNIIT